MNERFAICIENSGYEVSLEPWKVYRLLEDLDAERHGHFRVIDETGEDYLFPQDYFRLVELPEPVASLYRSAHTRE